MPSTKNPFDELTNLAKNSSQSQDLVTKQERDEVPKLCDFIQP